MMMRLSLIVLALGSSALRGQDTFLLMNAKADEHASCLSQDVSLSATMAACGKNPQGNEVAMRLGRTVRLRVLRRRFLTGYSLEMGNNRVVSWPVQFGGTVLAVSATRAAGSMSAIHPRIERKGTSEFLSELVDVTTSSEPLAEIEREYQELLVERDQVESAMSDFRQTWINVIGSGSVSGCGTGDLQLSALWLEACLHGEYDALHGPTGPAASEERFRSRAAEVDRLFQEARELSERLAQADLNTKAMAVEPTILAYQEDELSFWANLDSAKEAAWITQRLMDVPSDSALWLRVRELLRVQHSSAVTAAGAAKPVPDDAETNLLTERDFGLLKNKNGFQQHWRQELQTRIEQLQPANRDLVEFDKDLGQIRMRVYSQLPDLVSQINNWQERLAALMNEIYWNSEVDLTESDWGLGPIPADGTISYRVVRTSEFEPYVFRQTSSETVASDVVEVSRGALALTDTNAPRSRRTVWQILRFTK